MESAEGVATSVPSGRRLASPLIVAATFAAGAGVALAAKSVFESRRKGGADTQGADADMPSEEDLATTLRRAALDVAIAATNEAAERLSVDDEAEKQGQSR
jgi:hypothetical protein